MFTDLLILSSDILPLYFIYLYYNLLKKSSTRPMFHFKHYVHIWQETTEHERYSEPVGG